MNKKLAIILIGIAFLVGAMGGNWKAKRSLNQTTHQKIVTPIIALELGEIGHGVSMLNQIRANNITGAIDQLENNLDGSLAVLIGSQTFDMPQSQREQSLKAFQIAKEYRDKFPYTNEDAEISQTISNEFLLVDVKTNK